MDKYTKDIERTFTDWQKRKYAMPQTEYQKFRKGIEWLCSDESGGWKDSYYRLLKDEFGEIATPSKIKLIVDEWHRLNSDKIDHDKALNECLANLENDISEPHPLISRNGVKIISPGNISGVKGKAKSSKSKLSYDIVASYIGGGHLNFDASPLPGQESELIVDTEQGLPHLFRNARHINSQVGCFPHENNPKLNVISVRMLSESDGFEVMVHAIKKFRPGLVLLDGILDLAPAMNEEREAKLFIKMLYEVATEYNTHIMCVLHENKQSKDMQGHLGHYLLKKSEVVIGVEKDRDTGIVTIECSESRDKPFETFCYIINDSGFPELTEAPIKMTAKEVTKYNTALMFKKILTLKTMPYNVLKEQFSLNAGVSERTAANRIKEALASGILDVIGKEYSLKNNGSNDAEND